MPDRVADESAIAAQSEPAVENQELTGRARRQDGQLAQRVQLEEDDDRHAGEQRDRKPSRAAESAAQHLSGEWPERTGATRRQCQSEREQQREREQADTQHFEVERQTGQRINAPRTRGLALLHI